MDRLAQQVAVRFKEARQPPVVYLPSQTSVGFSVFVPSPKDAADLEKFIGRARLGKGRTRVQKSYMLDAVELHWMPTGPVPPFKEFQKVVEQWARRHGYRLARDMRELRKGLDELRA